MKKLSMDKQLKELNFIKGDGTMDNNHAKKIYNILIGINNTLINLPLSNSLVTDKSWERFNRSLDELKQAYNDDIFLEYKITPRKLDDDSLYVDRFEYGSKVYQTTFYLHEEYLSNSTIAPRQAQYKSNGLIMQQNTSQYQNQEQQQSQTQQQSIDQTVEVCIKNIEEHYGEEHANTAKGLLENVKKEPSKWSNVQKILNFSANLGKEAFIAVLPVLTQVLLPRK